MCRRKAPREVERRRDALVEDPDLRPVADADDVAVDEHGVAGAQLRIVALLGRPEGVRRTLGHQRLPVVVDGAVGADMWTSPGARPSTGS